MKYLTPENWLVFAQQIPNEKKLEYLLSVGTKNVQENMKESELDILFTLKFLADTEKKVESLPRKEQRAAISFIKTADAALAAGSYKPSITGSWMMDSGLFHFYKKTYPDAHALLKNIIEPSPENESSLDESPIGRCFFMVACESSYVTWTAEKEKALDEIQELVSDLSETEEKADLKKMLNHVVEFKAFTARVQKSIQSTRENKTVSDFNAVLQKEVEDKKNPEHAIWQKINDRIQLISPIIANDYQIRLGYNAWTKDNMDTFVALEAKVNKLPDGRKKEKMNEILHLVAFNRLRTHMYFGPIPFLGVHNATLSNEFEQLGNSLDLNEKEHDMFVGLANQVRSDEAVSVSIRMNEIEKAQEKEPSQEKESVQAMRQVQKHKQEKVKNLGEQEQSVKAASYRKKTRANDLSADPNAEQQHVNKSRSQVKTSKQDPARNKTEKTSTASHRSSVHQHKK